MKEKDRLVRQLAGADRGPAWHGPSLGEVLEGVTSGTAAYHPIAGAHSVGELVLHVTAWLDEAKRRLSEPAQDLTPEQDWPDFEGGEPAWQAAMDALRGSEVRLESAVSELPDDALDRKVAGTDYDVRFMLHGVISHNLYHAGQIALLKKARSL